MNDSILLVTKQLRSGDTLDGFFFGKEVNRQ